MNILVTGAGGQLGSEVKAIANDKHQYFFETSATLDITSKQKVLSFVSTNKIDIIINCAAYTAVDKAENEEQLAFNVNEKAVENLVVACENFQAKLIHISTDYVFDGSQNTPYKESDEVKPLGVYGQSKRKGEEVVLNSTIDALIIRTSWVYSFFGNNFVKTMMRLGQERENLGVIFDQVGTPTYAKDLAEFCMYLINQDFSKVGSIYHFSNEGVISWYDFAKAIMEIAHIDCDIKPIETYQYPTPAKRPQYSVLNKSKLKEDFNYKIPYWKDSLKECIQLLKK